MPQRQDRPDSPPYRDLRSALPLITAGFVIQFIMMGGGVDTISVFLNAVSESEGWSSAGLSMGIAIAALTAAVATPLVGMIVDRRGVRLPMAIGLGLFAVGYAIIGAMTAPWHWLAAQLFLGAGFAFSALLPLTIAVTVCIPVRTAFALGAVMTGASLGTLVLAPVLQAGIDAAGWRVTYMVLGTAVVLIPIPCVIFGLPRGRLPRAGAGGRGESPLARLDLGEELRRPGVLPLITVLLIPAAVSFGVHVHLVKYLSGIGHSAQLAATALGVTVGVSAVGKLGGGLLGDRVGPLQALRLAFLLELVAMLALGAARPLALLGVFVVCHGVALGTRVAVIPVIGLQVLGRERFGTLWGLLQLLITTAAAFAPVVPGVIYDRTGSYTGAVAFWAIAIGLGLLITIAWMRPPPRPQEAV